MNKGVVGYHIANKIDVGVLRDSFLYKVIAEEVSEIFYETKNGGLIYVFNYGSIVFIDISEEEQISILNNLKEVLNIEGGGFTKETFEVEVDPEKECKVLFNRLILNHYDSSIARIVMLNIAQSVALDFYSSQTEKLLEETRNYTLQLEETGKLQLKGKQLLKYIGRVLNLKNGIAENLYIFDSPAMAWENQNLNIIDRDLSRELDINPRHKSVVENLNIIKENLDFFKDATQHSHSSLLEWIVILLIFVEVAHMIIGWIF